jgi:hypothetical protein
MAYILFQNETVVHQHTDEIEQSWGTCYYMYVYVLVVLMKCLSKGSKVNKKTVPGTQLHNVMLSLRSCRIFATSV